MNFQCFWKSETIFPSLKIIVRYCSNFYWDQVCFKVKRVLRILSPTLKKVNVFDCLVEILMDRIRLWIYLETLLWKTSLKKHNRLIHRLWCKCCKPNTSYNFFFKMIFVWLQWLLMQSYFGQTLFCSKEILYEIDQRWHHHNSGGFL